MKTMMTVDPRLVQLLGDKLYSSHPLPIVVRELLQNSRDACVRADVNPDIRIGIWVDLNTYEATVECSDNGIGMTEEQLLNDFLCLGNTSKTHDNDAVGGFGIAKAALMRNPEWSVESLTNYIDQRILYEGLDIRHVAKREGTLVCVKITDHTSWSHVIKALQMIYFSDVRVNLHVEYGVSMKYDDPIAGWPEAIELEDLREGSSWEAFRFAKHYIAEVDESFEKLNIVRLNGLVQFTKTSWSDRKFNLLFEVTPTVRPDSKEYPLTMSREELTGPVNTAITELISECDANPLTMEHFKPKEEKMVLRDGYLLHGKRGYYIPEEERGLGRKIATFIVENSGEPTGKHQSLLLREYNEAERNVRLDSKALALWRELILECTSKDDAFGVGLIIDPHVNGARMTYEGKSYYLINPDTLMEAQTLEGKVLMTHMLACHEASHFRFFNHGESHSAEQSQIFRETIEIVLANMKEYKQLIR